MADFKRVIENAVKGLAQNTPEARVRVYDRARQTVQRQLEALPDNIDRSTFERQKERVEQAILEIEALYGDGAPMAQERPAPDLATSPATNPAKGPVEDAAEQVTPQVGAPQTVEHETVAPQTVVPQEAAQELAASEPIEKEPVAAPVHPPKAGEDDISQELAIPFHEINRPLGQPDTLGQSDTLDQSDNLGGSDPFAQSDKRQGEDNLKDDLANNVDHSEGDRKNANDAPRNVSYEGEAKGPNQNSDADEADRIIEAAVGQIQSKLDGNDGRALNAAPGDKTFGLGVEALPKAPPPKAQKSPIVIIIAGLLLVMVGLAFVIWRTDWQDVRQSVTGIVTSQDAVQAADAGAEGGAAEDITSPDGAGDADIVQGNEQATASPLNNASGTDQKFTQRLNPDGTETDVGPADNGEADIAAIEGTSVAEQVVTGDQANALALEDGIGVTEDGQAIQRMYLYETSLGLDQQARYEGSVVWSDQTENGNRPFIEALIQVPDRDITITLAIKQNTDLTLPVSHLFDIGFDLPDDFEGGAIEQVTEVKFKTEEEQTGDGLQAISAQIDPTFFIVGLQNDSDEIVAANVQLMLQRNWIDIPITYSNGRKALITLEKGASGQAIFEKAFAFWEQNPVQ